MSVLPLNWPDKNDSPELVAWLQQFGLDRYINAEQINKLRDGVNELFYSLNPDRIITIGTETIAGNEHSYEGYVWQLGGVEIDNAGNPSTFIIPAATVGFKRKDISVFTSEGNIIRVAGDETDGDIVATPPTPPGTLYFKSYDIDGDSIEVDPEPPIYTGTQFKQKNESQKFTSVLGGTNAQVILRIFGQQHYAVIGPVTSIAGFSKSLITSSPASELPYNGKDFFFENKTDHDITLKNAFSPVDISFDFGADIVVPSNGIVWMKYDLGTEKMKFFFKSWADPIDLSTKADLVGGKVPASQLPSYVDDVLEFADFDSFPTTGETGIIYVALDTNFTYRWTGSAYVHLSSGIDFPSDGKTYGVKDGIPVELLSDLYRSWFSYMANNAGAMLVVNTGNLLTVSGTSAVVPRSSTSIYSSIIMNNCVSAATNGSNAGIKNNNASDGVYREGADAYFLWANNDANSQCCTSVGLYSLLLAVPNLNPSNFTASTMICANDQGDANLSFIVNRTVATASFLKIDCGSQFPANSTTDAYLLRIEINKTENQVQRVGKMTIYNIVTGHSFSYAFTGAQMPDSNANFAVMINRGNRNSGVTTNIRPAKIHVTRKLF